MMSEATKKPTLSQPAAQVVGWMISGHSSTDIAQALQAHYPDADTAPMIRDAITHLRTAGDSVGNKALMRGWVLESLRDLYRRSVEASDTASALQCVKMIASISHL
jgi:hypothetical protein